MSLTKKIAFNTAIQLGGKVIGTIFGLLGIVILTRALGVEKFGWYVTATGFLQFIGILADFGFTAATSSLLSNPKYDREKLLNNIFTLRFITGLFFNGLAAAIIFLFPYRIEIKIAVAILSLSFFFLSLNQVFWGYYQRILKLTVPAIAEILSRIALVIGLYLLYKGGYDFIAMMIMVTAAALILTGYMWAKSGGIKFYLEKELTKKIAIHMWPLALAVIFNAFYLHGDKLLLPLYTDQTSVGLYGAAYRVIEIIIQVMSLTAGLLMPLVAYSWNTNDRKEFEKRYQMTFDTMSLLVLPMCAGIIALATPIMELVAGKEFAGSGPILQLLTIAIIGILFGLTFSSMAIAINQQKRTVWVFAGTAVIAVILYLILIPQFTIWGAAAVTVFAELLSGIGLYFCGCHLARYYPSFKNFLKILLASVIMGYLSYIIPSPHVIISIIYGIIIYSILIVILKVISKKTLVELASFKK